MKTIEAHILLMIQDRLQKVAEIEHSVERSKVSSQKFCIRLVM